MKYFSKDFYKNLGSAAKTSPKKALLVGGIGITSLVLVTGTASAVVLNNRATVTAAVEVLDEQNIENNDAQNNAEKEATDAKAHAEETEKARLEEEKAEAERAAEEAHIIEEANSTDASGNRGSSNVGSNRVTNNSNSGNSGNSGGSTAPPSNSSNGGNSGGANSGGSAPAPAPSPAPSVNNPTPPAPAPLPAPPQQAICGENMEPDDNGGCRAIVWTIGQMIAEVQSYIGGVPVNGACIQNPLYAGRRGFEGSPDHIAFMRNGPWRAMNVVDNGGTGFTVYLCR